MDSGSVRGAISVRYTTRPLIYEGNNNATKYVPGLLKTRSDDLDVTGTRVGTLCSWLELESRRTVRLAARFSPHVSPLEQLGPEGFPTVTLIDHLDLMTFFYYRLRILFFPPISESLKWRLIFFF